MNFKKHVGKYKVHNKAKYVANLQEVVYRSSWELKYMKYLDRHPSVLEWASENVIIPYYNQIEKKTRRYFVDFYVKIQNPEGEIKKYIIEVKPKRQCVEPKVQRTKNKKYIREVMEYAKNQAKWGAAKEFCKDRMMEFKILTEDNLGV